MQAKINESTKRIQVCHLQETSEYVQTYVISSLLRDKIAILKDVENEKRKQYRCATLLLALTFAGHLSGLHEFFLKQTFYL